LEALTWLGSPTADPFVVAILRRAVSLHTAFVLHASALAAVVAGPIVDIGCGEAATVHPLLPCMCAPLSNVRALTLAAVGGDTDDPTATLVTILAASPRVSAFRLWWFGSAPMLWGLLHAVASAVSHEAGAGWHRVRRVRIDVNDPEDMPDRETTARCVRALFPRARYASWGANGWPDVELLPV
jgi:hypothetical protein